MKTKIPFAVLCTGAVLGASAGPAHATFPWENGRIAYTWSSGGQSLHGGPNARLVGIFSIRPGGGGKRLIARGALAPRYSPSGRQIAFSRANRLWAARADGTGAHPSAQGAGSWRSTCGRLAARASPSCVTSATGAGRRSSSGSPASSSTRIST
jgi:hypothetical protein